MAKETGFLDELTSTFNALKKKFPGYENRPQQVAMAKEVFTCFKDKGRLLAEAGTGIGKSFAYLIPAILSGEKTVVSTASIALQDQLVNKDLVFLQGALPPEFSFAILKGKNNYLCLKREKEFQPELGRPYERFAEWVSETETGDKDELSFVPAFWSRVCGDSDDCGIARCHFFRNCFYYRHYRRLHKKDILVINHHLLIYDLLSDFNILPFHGRLIIDEAHQIENIISHVMGGTLSYARIAWLLFRLRGLKVPVDHLFPPLDILFREKAVPSGKVSPLPTAIVDGLQNLRDVLSLKKIARQLTGYQESLDNEETKERIVTTLGYLNSLETDIEDFIEQGNDNKVYYVSGNNKFIELRSNMVESQAPFGLLITAYESVVMTSATLTTDKDFRFIRQRLGITDFREIIAGSPFDYRKQSILYIDKGLPSPVKGNIEAFQQEGLTVIEGLINASGGRALLLFTSYRHLRFVSENIGTDFPLRSQGDMPPAKLIKWFRDTPGSVILATATFWQGIDIKGDDLSLVIIVKMPFGSPGDPVYDERCRRLGRQWFRDLALPSAILLLKQGVGRLIRGVDDFGVVAILDTRLVTSSYGKNIVSSLPDMHIVHGIDDVRRFFNESASLEREQARTLKTV